MDGVVRGLRRLADASRGRVEVDAELGESAMLLDGPSSSDERPPATRPRRSPLLSTNSVLGLLAGVSDASASCPALVGGGGGADARPGFVFGEMENDGALMRF